MIRLGRVLKIRSGEGRTTGLGVAMMVFTAGGSAFGQSGTDRLPILLSPEIGGIAGRPGSAEELVNLLRKELHLSGGGG